MLGCKVQYGLFGGNSRNIKGKVIVDMALGYNVRRGMCGGYRWEDLFDLTLGYKVKKGPYGGYNRDMKRKDFVNGRMFVVVVDPVLDFKVQHVL